MCDCETVGVTVTDAASGDVICTACGVVLEAHIFDDRLEFATEERAGHAGSWLLPAVPVAFDVKRARALSNVDEHASTRDFFRVIDTMSAGFMTDVVDTAKMLCRDLMRIKTVKTCSRQQHAAAALYLATKMCGHSRSRREVSKMFDLSTERLTALTKVFVNALGSTHPQLLQKHVEVGDLINRAVDRLELNDQKDVNLLKKTARDIADRCTSHESEGKTPRGVCGGVLALALQSLPHLTVSKGSVAAACMISYTTVDKMVRHLKVHLCN